jgi:hypothetical protein
MSTWAASRWAETIGFFGRFGLSLSTKYFGHQIGKTD